MKYYSDILNLLCSYVSCSVVSDFLQPLGLLLVRLLSLWDSSVKYAGVDCHSLLQRIFQT